VRGVETKIRKVSFIIPSSAMRLLRGRALRLRRRKLLASDHSVGTYLDVKDQFEIFIEQRGGGPNQWGMLRDEEESEVSAMTENDREFFDSRGDLSFLGKCCCAADVSSDVRTVDNTLMTNQVQKPQSSCCMRPSVGKDDATAELSQDEDTCLAASTNRPNRESALFDSALYEEEEAMRNGTTLARRMKRMRRVFSLRRMRPEARRGLYTA
jgi:hypothetical protein